MVAPSALPVVWAESTQGHRPEREVWIGMPMAGSEVPERVTVIEQVLREVGHPFVDGTSHGRDAFTGVHSPDLVRHLSPVYGAWQDGGYVALGQDRVVPNFFPTAAMLGPLPVTEAAAVHGRAGQFRYDTMTTLGPRS